MDHTPKQMRELATYIESIPFGEVDIKVRRVDHKTTQITTVAEETLRYVSNQEALQDLDILVSRLIDSSFSGDAHVKLEMKDGQIRIVGIITQKQTNYR